jgi:hypothetical protein
VKTLVLAGEFASLPGWRFCSVCGFGFWFLLKDEAMSVRTVEFESPVRKVMALLKKGRGNWKSKYQAVKVEVRRVKQQNRVVENSREQWKQRGLIAGAELKKDSPQQLDNHEQPTNGQKAGVEVGHGRCPASHGHSLRFRLRQEGAPLRAGGGDEFERGGWCGADSASRRERPFGGPALAQHRAEFSAADRVV